jgi:two-component system, LytTR family, response regulator
MDEQIIPCIIVDDNESNLTNLQILIANYCPNLQILATATTVEQAISAITKLKPVLLFLDVEIQNKTAFDLLEQLENRNFNVIFVTAFDKYAIKAFRFSAIDYLLKPIVIEELECAVKKVQEKLNEANPYKELENLMSNLKKEKRGNRRIGLPLNGAVAFVPVSDILRCLGESSYTTFFIKDGTKMVVSKTLKEYDELLKEYDFMRVNKSNLINMNYVKSFVKTADAYIVMDDGSSIPVSNLKKQEIMQYMTYGKQ